MTFRLSANAYFYFHWMSLPFIHQGGKNHLKCYNGRTEATSSFFIGDYMENIIYYFCDKCILYLRMLPNILSQTIIVKPSQMSEFFYYPSGCQRSPAPELKFFWVFWCLVQSDLAWVKSNYNNIFRFMWKNTQNCNSYESLNINHYHWYWFLLFFLVSVNSG